MNPSLDRLIDHTLSDFLAEHHLGDYVFRVPLMARLWSTRPVLWLCDWIEAHDHPVEPLRRLLDARAERALDEGKHVLTYGRGGGHVLDHGDDCLAEPHEMCDVYAALLTEQVVGFANDKGRHIVELDTDGIAMERC